MITIHGDMAVVLYIYESIVLVTHGPTNDG